MLIAEYNIEEFKHGFPCIYYVKLSENVVNYCPKTANSSEFYDMTINVDNKNVMTPTVGGGVEEVGGGGGGGY